MSRADTHRSSKFGGRRHHGATVPELTGEVVPLGVGHPAFDLARSDGGHDAPVALMAERLGMAVPVGLDAPGQPGPRLAGGGGRRLTQNGHQMGGNHGLSGESGHPGGPGVVETGVEFGQRLGQLHPLGFGSGQRLGPPALV